MHGNISISVYNARVRYEFTLHRNITVLCDEGATGKTSLIRMIRRAEESSSTKVEVSNALPLTILDAQTWRVLTNNNKNIKKKRFPQVFVVDESAQFLASGDFADFVWSSGCYFLLITRENLSSLSCSTKEMYCLHTENRKTTFVQLYPDTVYGKLPTNRQIITEDSKFGKRFFEEVYGHGQVISAKGKDNVDVTLSSTEFEHPIVIVDGAAFGFNMHDVLEIVQCMNGQLIVEESFEYMLLTSGMFNKYRQRLEKEMQNIDCHEFITWERFFTAFLEEVTRGTPLAYKKDGYNHRYLESAHKDKILRRYGLLALTNPKNQAYLAPNNTSYFSSTSDSTGN